MYPPRRSTARSACYRHGREVQGGLKCSETIPGGSLVHKEDTHWQDRELLPYALEIDSPLEAAGLEPLHQNKVG
jgi:hypothetical protein